MLKYIQEIFQALKESSKSKLRVKKSKGNRFDITRAKPSIHPEILAPNVGNEKFDIENTKNIVNIKNTYEMLMNKFINPRLDLMVSGMTSLEQLKLLHLKMKKDIISSSASNADPQQNMSTLPSNKSKETDSTPEGTVAKVGWSGQPTAKHASAPKVETSLYPGDIHSAFFVFPEIEEPFSTTKPKQESKGHKLHRKINNKTLTPLRVKNKPVKLVKRIPKSHISKFYDFNKRNNTNGSQKQKDVLNHIQPSSKEDNANKENVKNNSFKKSETSEIHDIEEIKINDGTKLVQTNKLSDNQLFTEDTSLMQSGNKEDTEINTRNILKSGDSVECVNTTELISDTRILNQTAVNNMTSDKPLQVDNFDKSRERLSVSQNSISPEKTSPIETSLFQCKDGTEKLKLYENANECNVEPLINEGKADKVRCKPNDNSENTDIIGKQNDNATEKTVEAKSIMPVVYNYNDGLKCYKNNNNNKVFRDKYLEMAVISKPKKEIHLKKGSVSNVTLTSNLKQTKTSDDSVNIEQAIADDQYDYLKLVKSKVGSFDYNSKGKGIFSDLTSSEIEEKERAKVNIMNKTVSKQRKGPPKTEKNVNIIKGFKPRKTNRSISLNLFNPKKEITNNKSNTFSFKQNKKGHVWKTKFDGKLSLKPTLPKNNTNRHSETIQMEMIFDGKAMNPVQYLQPNAATKDKFLSTGMVKTERDANKLCISHSCIDTVNKTNSNKVLFYKPKLATKHGQRELVFKKPIVKQSRCKIETHNTNKICKSNVPKSRSDNVINTTVLFSNEKAKFRNKKQLIEFGVKSISRERVVKTDKVYTKINVPQLIDISLDKARKLHSKKLNPKPMPLKMYGKEKMYDIESNTPDIRSLKSVPIVCKVNKIAKRTKPLGNLKRSSVENMRNVQKNPSDLIMSTKIHTRNLFTAEYKANMMVNYLYRRFASTAVERDNTSNRLMVKSTTKKVSRVSTAPNVLDELKSKPQATRTTTCSDQIKPLETVLKYNHKTKYILPTSLLNGTNKSASAAMVKNKKGYHKQNVLDRKCDSEIYLKKPLIELTPGKPQKNDYKVEVLYSRQDNKKKPIHQRENTINIVTAVNRGSCNADSDHINFNLITNNKPSQKQSMHTGSTPKTIIKQSNNYCSDSPTKTGPENGGKNEHPNKNLKTNNLMKTCNQNQNVHLNDRKKNSKKRPSENKIKRYFFTNAEPSKNLYKLKLDNCSKVVQESKLRDPTVTLDSVDKVVKEITAPIKVTSSQVDLHHKKCIDSVLTGPKKWKSKVERLQQNKVVLENSSEKHNITGNSRKMTIIKCSSTNNNMNLISSATSERSEIKHNTPNIGILEVSPKEVIPNKCFETYTEFMKGEQSDKQLAVTNKKISTSKYKSKNSISNLQEEKQAKFTELKRHEENQIKTDQINININRNDRMKQKESCRIIPPRPTKQIGKISIDMPLNKSKISNNIISETSNRHNEQNISRTTDNKATMPLSTNTTLPEVDQLTKLVPLDITGVDLSLNKTLINSSNKLQSDNSIKECNGRLKDIAKTAELSEPKRTFDRNDNKSSLKIDNESSVTANATNEIHKSNYNILSKYQKASKGTVSDQTTSNTKTVADNNDNTFKENIEKVDTNTCLATTPASIDGIRLLKDSKRDCINDIEIKSKLSSTTKKLSIPPQLQNAIELGRSKSMIFKRTTKSKEAINKSKLSGLIEMGNKNGLSSKPTDLRKATTESSKLPVSIELANKQCLGSKLTDVSEEIGESRKSLSSNELVKQTCPSSKITDISERFLETSKTSDSINLRSQNQNKDIRSKTKPFERNIDYSSKRNTLHEGLLRSLKLTVHPVQSITNVNFNRKPQINSLEENMTGKKEKDNFSKKQTPNKGIEHSIPPKNIKVHQLAIAELRKFEKKTKEGVKTIVNHVLNKGSEISPIYINPTQTQHVENQVKLDKRVHPIEKEKYDLVFLPPNEDLLSDMPTDKADITPNTLPQSSSRHVERNNTTKTHENKEIQSLKPTGIQLNSGEPKKRVTVIKESRSNENPPDILLL